MSGYVKKWLDPAEGLIAPEAFIQKLPPSDRREARKELTKELMSVDAYTLNRPVRHNFQRRRVVILGVDDLWQADLADMSAYANQNDGYKYLLVVIDCWSKFAWVIPLKTKGAKEVTGAFKSILQKGRVPKNLQTDEGREFFNRDFHQLMEEYKINHYHTYSDMKASIAERFNRTLKMRISRWWDVVGTHKYIDKLEAIINNYNHTKSRATGMTPVEASEEKNEEKVKERLFPPVGETSQHPKFKVGDIVRIARKLGVFSKESVGGWSMELFKVKAVVNTVPITYELEDLKDEPIKGKFYQQELQKVEKKDDVYKVEKILQTKTVRGKKKHLVKWLGYDDTFNSWVNDEDMV